LPRRSSNGRPRPGGERPRPTIVRGRTKDGQGGSLAGRGRTLDGRPCPPPVRGRTLAERGLPQTGRGVDGTMDRRKQRRHHVVHPLSLAALTLLAATLWPARARPASGHLMLAPASFADRDTEAALLREGRRDRPGVLAGGFWRQAFRPTWTFQVSLLQDLSRQTPPVRGANATERAVLTCLMEERSLAVSQAQRGNWVREKPHDLTSREKRTMSLGQDEQAGRLSFTQEVGRLLSAKCGEIQFRFR